MIGPLAGGQAAAVLHRKLAGNLVFRAGTAREAIVTQVLNYLYIGSDTDQAIAEIRCFDNSRRLLCRKHVVTGAMLDEAVGAAKDECLKNSAAIGELIGIDSAGIIRSLEAQYRSLAVTLKPHNVAEHCPQWFEQEPLRVESVKPLKARSRKSPQMLID